MTKRSLNDQIIKYTRIVYIIAIIFWLVLVISLGLSNTNIIGYLLIMTPIIIFIINIYWADRIVYDNNNKSVRDNIFTFGLLITAVLINWNNPNLSDKYKFFKIVVVAIILLMFSMIDIQMPYPEIMVVNSIKSSLQTMSLVLLALSLYIYYLEHCRCK